MYGQIGYFDSIVSRVSIAHLTREKLKEVFCLVPSIEEQKSIACYLNDRTQKIDTLIEKKQKLIELLKEEHTAIINQAVTKGLNPDAPMKDSGIEWLGEIPKHWKVGKLGALASVKARLGWRGLKASEYINDGYIFLSTPNIKNKDIDFTDVNYISNERYFESPEIMLNEGDVLIAKDGSTLGITNVIKQLPAPATVNSSIQAVPKPRFSEFSIISTFLPTPSDTII